MVELYAPGIGTIEIDDDELKKAVASSMAFQMAHLIREKAIQMDLKETSNFIQSIQVEVGEDDAEIFSDADYSGFLEYGTLTYAGLFSEKTFPSQPVKKKKNISSNRAKKSLPKGMAPFAPFRRVAYNKTVVDKLMVKAVKDALE